MDLQVRERELAGEVVTHKAAIRRHRCALSRAAADLAEVRRELARRGIRLVLKGEGGNPWPNLSSVSTSSSLDP